MVSKAEVPPVKPSELPLEQEPLVVAVTRYVAVVPFRALLVTKDRGKPIICDMVSGLVLRTPSR